jgi:hypothetical protein
MGSTADEYRKRKRLQSTPNDYRRQLLTAIIARLAETHLAWMCVL